MAQLKKFTVYRGSTIQTILSLTTVGIYCLISSPLSGVMEDCSTVWVQQLQMLYRRRCCMSTSQRMFCSLWNVVTKSQGRMTHDDNQCYSQTCWNHAGVTATVVSHEMTLYLSSGIRNRMSKSLEMRVCLKLNTNALKTTGFMTFEWLKAVGNCTVRTSVSSSLSVVNWWTG